MILLFILIDRICKVYGNFVVFDNVLLEICLGEFLILLGFFGLGKIMLLMVLVGFVWLDVGYLCIVGCDIIWLVFNWCDIGIVF